MNKLIFECFLFSRVKNNKVKNTIIYVIDFNYNKIDKNNEYRIISNCHWKI
jgi:hypothetical protein